VPMTTASAHEFFVATASVAGALIGLLFVAVSVASESISGPDLSEVHALRAAASLTAFTNALTVSLFALVPGFDSGIPAISVACAGILFVAGGLVRALRAGRAKQVHLRDVSFLAGLLGVFVIQLIAGIGLERSAHDTGDVQALCVLVIVCFLIGIERAWELVGGPQVGIFHELGAMLGGRKERERTGDGEEDREA
jgi:hypothetical protein